MYNKYNLNKYNKIAEFILYQVIQERIENINIAKKRQKKISI